MSSRLFHCRDCSWALSSRSSALNSLYFDHALLDNSVAARAQPGTEENIGDITAPALAAVEEIFALPFPGHLPAHGDLGIAGVLAADAAVVIVEDQFDRGLAHRLAIDRAVEDHIGHVLAAQVLRRALAHHPANRVDHVGFAATIGPDHRAHIARKLHMGRVDKGFEARQLD